jgi:hypothetical protein
MIAMCKVQGDPGHLINDARANVAAIHEFLFPALGKSRSYLDSRPTRDDTIFPRCSISYFFYIHTVALNGRFSVAMMFGYVKGIQ